MNLKIHEDAFILLPREITFTCNACGLIGERNPYVCIACDLMIHKVCIDLPRVININRHDHRVSLTYHLGHGKSRLCAVCQESIDWTFGGYACKRCPDYAVHSNCATDKRVWDGKELEDVPEEDEEILDPYKMINCEKEIIHFSHEEHNLILVEDNVKEFEKIRCDACILPLDDGMFYKCVEGDFFLHKLYECLNHIEYQALDCGVILLDARCGSISEPFIHPLHSHPLYHTLETSKTCVACGENSPNVLTCKECGFYLDIKCATLPTTCVLGDMSHIKPECLDVGSQVIPNNGMTRPFCGICKLRCMFPNIMMNPSPSLECVCSMECIFSLIATETNET
ncbi:hypothetical protein AALP_AA3G073700 [Arabis alpina]|uniref:Phorbol-ester/DAG-type domain-containing protein n=1 Tax=Arabis alpina TaxID=50452 RepID=A0A087H7M9_ARAAL|nr:hypothetical protein AALP_AA3G073700 [Arabis alpina]